MLTAMEPYMNDHLSDLSSEARINLGLARGFTSRDYVSCNKVRAFGTKLFDEIYRKVDVVVTPATGITAPYISPDAIQSGETDLEQTTELMRYAFLGNLLGLPAVVVPVGQDSNSLPIGLQMMGSPWSESVLLRLAHAAEQHISNSKPMLQPEVFYDLLKPRMS